MDINNTLSKLLGNNKSIDEVQIDPKVIDEIVKIAINADPNEYVALLSGKIHKNILKVTGLIFLPFEASNTSAVMQVFMMPMTTNAVGSVHSHPGPSAMPSNADLIFFGKNGYFHMIICRPYSQATIKSYDALGNPVPFVVKDLGDEVEIKQLEDFDIDDEFFDEELIKELKKDEALEEKLEEEELEEEKLEEEDLKEDEKLDEIEKKLQLEEINMKNDKNKDKPEIIPPQIPSTINLEFEIGGKKINKELPLPPEYEPGDEIEVDIRTDKTPGDSIDEINLNVKKAPKNVAAAQGSNKVLTVTPSASSNTSKSSNQIDKEIEQMESEIEKLKRENERLRKGL